MKNKDLSTNQGRYQMSSDKNPFDLTLLECTANDTVARSGRIVVHQTCLPERNSPSFVMHEAACLIVEPTATYQN